MHMADKRLLSEFIKKFYKSVRTSQSVQMGGQIDRNKPFT